METREERGALHVPPGGGRSLWLLGELYTVKARGEDTDGAFVFVEATTPPQAGHHHTYISGKTRPSGC